MSSIGIVHTIGNVVFGFLGDCNRVNRSILYIVFQCGLPAFVSRWFHCPGIRCHLQYLMEYMVGFFTASSEALSCIIVDDILGTSSLSDGYGILMLIQGIANLGGPPLAGTGTHTQTHILFFFRKK